MESGGKAVTKRYRKKSTVVLSLVLPVILLFAILNCFTTYVFYEDYKYKMNLMTDIAAKEQFSGLDAVSELLKDKDIETNELGRRLLEQYGYWGNKGNVFYSQFRHQVLASDRKGHSESGEKGQFRSERKDQNSRKQIELGV